MYTNDAVFERYEIDLNIDMEKRPFSGKVRINVENREEDLFLDMEDMEIKGVSVNGNDGKFSILDDNRILKISTGKGKKRIEIDYTGNVNEKLSGLYRAKYKEGVMLTTQFESTGARRVFPCADNPSSKAVFSIRVRIGQDLDAIGNMPVKSEVRNGDGTKTVEFEETPRMSTYLIYLGIGKFSQRKSRSGNTDIILAAPEKHLTDSTFPDEITYEVLKRFNAYFGIDYVLPKVHIISVPEFAAGAMENWGAITFREIYLSIGKSTSLSTYKGTAEVIAHELAHQWFGNLVTMKWWNDLWLNESFATFMSYKIVQEIKEKWNPVGDQIFLRTEGALRNDSFKLTHPIDAKVKDPSEIAEIFDEISYGKGSSILRMIETYMGRENFRKGISAYLKKFSYSNAEGRDLWESLERESGMEISRIMEKWIKEEGYPIIVAEKNGNRIHLEQGRFYGNGNIDGSKVWPIPLVIKRNGKYESHLMDGKEMEIELDGISSFNGHSAGFYRVKISEDLLDSISKNMNQLNEFEMYNFLSDNFAILSAGMIRGSEFLKRMKIVWKSEYPMVIREISRELDLLYTLLDGSEKIGKEIKEFYSIHKDMKKEDESDPNVKIAYNSLISVYSRSDRNFRRDLSSQFNSFFEQEPESRAMIARAFAVEEGKAEKIIEFIEKSENDEDRVKLISALGQIGNEDGLKKGFDYVMAGNIKKQDLPSYIVSLGTNMHARNFFVGNFQPLMERLHSIFEASRTTTRTMENTVPFATLGNDESLKHIKEMEFMKKFEKTIGRIEEIREIYTKTAKSF